MTSGRPGTRGGLGARQRTRRAPGAARTPAAVSTIETLVESLRARILQGEFAPGTGLAEMEVADAYGVARPTARAAIQRLVSDQVLRQEPNHSARVPELTHADVRDLWSVRTPLELMVVAQIVKRGLRPAKAEHAVRRLERMSGATPWPDVVDLDCVFHLELIKSVDSPRLARIYESLQGEMRLALLQLGYVYQSAAEAAAQHRELFEAVVGGSKSRALRAMTKHLNSAVADLTGAAPDPP